MDLVHGTQILGNLGEFFGAAAVVATLVYVAIQVRQTRTLIQGQVQQSSFALQASYLGLVGGSEEVSRLLVKGRRSFTALSEEERVRFISVVSLALNFIEHSLRQPGLPADELDQEALRRLVQHFLGYPGGREYWRTYRDIYSAKFAAWVEEQLALLDVTSDDSPESG